MKLILTLLAFANGLQAPASAPLELDMKRRPMTAVQINEGMMVDMLVDTGAQSSLLTTTLSQSLALPHTGETVTVNGAAGSTLAPVVAIRRMTTPLFDLRDATLIVLPRLGVTQAQGIVGMDLFSGRKLTFDLVSRKMSVANSGPAPDGYATVKGAVQGNGLLHVPLTVDGVVIDALVDTGAEGSVANDAVLRALGWKDDDPRLKANGTMSGATAGSAAVRRGTVGMVSLGPVNFRNVPLTFTGATDTTPRIILGIDMLGLLQRFALDLPRAELQIYVPPRPTASATPRTGS
ncbi:retroviral-like aspartic protease family protein [Sphingomonas sp. Leaf67]|uniref:retroviral-like aspartic protease family protein n=1 Tax=Sphingomonas sp. Leaf67 TaxID=1736230 RepID=UPI0009E95180|nr:retroviral-like aspartic protease family protein [Sphingomonas sp. Leaf67]